MRTSTRSSPLSKLNPPSRRGLVLAAMPLVLAVTLWWPLAGGHQVVMTAGPSVPSAKGMVYVTQDRNKNTNVDMKVRYLARPSALTPAGIAFVVWIQRNGRAAEDQGELHVGNDLAGEFTTVSPYKGFTIFVTAEQSPQAPSPTGDSLLTAQIAQ